MGDYFIEREIISKAVKIENLAKEIIYEMSDKIR